MNRVLLLLYFTVLYSASGQQSSGSSQDGLGPWTVSAKEQTIDGHIYHLRGQAEMRNTDLVFRADMIDFDEDKAVVHLTGHAMIESRKGTTRGDVVDYCLTSGMARSRIRRVILW